MIKDDLLPTIIVFLNANTTLPFFTEEGLHRKAGRASSQDHDMVSKIPKSVSTLRLGGLKQLEEVGVGAHHPDRDAQQ